MYGHKVSSLTKEEKSAYEKTLRLEFERRMEMKKVKSVAAAATGTSSCTKSATGTTGKIHYKTHLDESFTCCEEGMEDEHELQLLLISGGMFRSKVYLGPEEERKTCIWPGGEPVSWTELSCGYSWVGVRGTDTTCVVSLSEPIRKRPDDKVQPLCRAVLRGALADMLGDTGFSFHPRIPQSSHAGPVAVVSVAPCLPGQECQQASCAINFLKEKLKDCSSLSSEETEQIAICALMYLLGRKFQPNEIQIDGWGNYNGDTGRMTEERVLRAIKQTITTDLTNSVSVCHLLEDADLQ